MLKVQKVDDEYISVKMKADDAFVFGLTTVTVAGGEKLFQSEFPSRIGCQSEHAYSLSVELLDKIRNLGFKD